MTQSHAGKLLVASPKLADPNFARAVVLLLSHGLEGAFGVIVNRPLELEITGQLAAWAPLASPPARIFEGGPVEPAGALALSRWLSPAMAPEGWASMAEGVGVLDLNLDASSLPLDDIEGFRLFAGYSGWGAGQLEAELRDEAWFVVDAEPGDPFDPDPEELWRRVLRRQPGKLALFAYFPSDPRAN